MANKTYLVAQREFLENLRTKTFWIGILVFPVLLVISIGAGWVLAKLKDVKAYTVIERGTPGLAARIERTAREPDLQRMLCLMAENKALSAALADLAREFGNDLGTLQPAANGKAPEVPPGLVDRLHQRILDLPASSAVELMAGAKGIAGAKYEYRSPRELGIDQLSVAEQEQELNARVGRGELFAYFVLGKDPVADIGDSGYVSNNLTDNDLRRWYADAATKVVQAERIAAAGVAPETARRLQEQFTFREQKVGDSGRAEDVKLGEKANKYAPVGFVYMLWIAVFTAAQMLLTNTVEEKSNRIIEVLLSSVSPLQLMSGKIWGIAATGLTIVGSWVLCALIGVWATPRLIAGFDFPLMAVIGDPRYLISFVVYFFLGYLLFAAILVGIGSVCNSLKEAQNLLQPVFLLLIVPLITMMFVVQEPNGLVAKVLSYIPLFTPFTMMNRAGGPPEPYEYVVTGILLLASVWFAFRAAGRIFRVGVLMTGNPPRLKEVLGWLRRG